MNLKLNDKLELIQDENKIIISKSNNKKISLEEKFKEYHGENLAKDFTWDEDRGREIW